MPSVNRSPGAFSRLRTAEARASVAVRVVGDPGRAIHIEQLAALAPLATCRGRLETLERDTGKGDCGAITDGVTPPVQPAWAANLEADHEGLVLSIAPSLCPKKGGANWTRKRRSGDIYLKRTIDDTKGVRVEESQLERAWATLLNQIELGQSVAARAGNQLEGIA